MFSDLNTRAEVEETLARMLAAFEALDAGQVAAMHGADPDVVMIGAEPQETYRGSQAILEGLRLSLKERSSLKLQLTALEVSSAGAVAWVDADMGGESRREGRRKRFRGRFTAVLEKREGRWLVMQSHFSFPASDMPE